MNHPSPAVWFPAVRAGTGADVFTKTLAAELRNRGIRTEITWLPLRAEYAPWSARVPQPPAWANIVHVNTWLHPRFIPCHLPVVATLHHSIHDPDLLLYKGWLRAAYHRHWIARIERVTMRRSSQVVAVSRFAARSAQQHLLNCPISVISNGVDVEHFRPPLQRLPHSPFRLLYVGGWKPLKGVDLLPVIMGELGADFELRYTGGPAADADRAKMPANMHDLGRLDGNGVLAAMHDADALLFPSRSEGLPLTVLEAMACGLPVVATQGSSLVEIIKNDVNGLLCPRDDASSFEGAVRRLAANLEKYTLMSEASRALIERHYTLNNTVNAYNFSYEKILSKA